MRKFNIRTQFLVLGMGFLALILATAVIGIWAERQISREYEQANRYIQQASMVNIVKEDMDQAITDSLLMADGNPNARASLLANLQEVRDQAPLLERLLMSEDVPEAADPQALEAARAVLADIAEIPAMIDGFAALPEEERRQSHKDITFPLLSRYAEQFDTVQEEIAAKSDRFLKTLDTVIAAFKARFLIANAVAVLVTLGFALLMGRGMAKPIKAMAASTERLRNRDYESDIAGTAHADELGQAARALDELRGELKEAAALRESQRAIRARREALFAELGAAMTDLSQGRLDRRMALGEWDDLDDGYRNLCLNFNVLGENIGALVGAVRESADMVEQNARDLSAMSDGMSRRAETQAATLEESAAALAQMSTGVHAAARRAQEADSLVVAGREKAEAGGAVMERALAAMGSIATASEQINNIIGVIDDIAFQTNLLALNAGVEAARAGESGKGFSVVASEVRSLAQRASDSAKEIKALVSESAQRVHDGGQLVEATSQTLTEIVKTVNEVARMVSDIAVSSQEQSSGLEEINAGVGDLDRVTQENVASVNEVSSASQGLNQEASRLTQLLGKFDGAGKRDDASPGDAADDAFRPGEKTASAFAPATPARDEGAADPDRPAARAAAAGDRSGVWEEF